LYDVQIGGTLNPTYYSYLNDWNYAILKLLQNNIIYSYTSLSVLIKYCFFEYYLGWCPIEFGQKVIYRGKIHFVFFDYENGLLEIQDPMTKAVILTKYDDIIIRVK